MLLFYCIPNRGLVCFKGIFGENVVANLVRLRRWLGEVYSGVSRASGFVIKVKLAFVIAQFVVLSGVTMVRKMLRFGSYHAERDWFVLFTFLKVVMRLVVWLHTLSWKCRSSSLGYSASEQVFDIAHQRVL